jgi:hypothetical protein
MFQERGSAVPSSPLVWLTLLSLDAPVVAALWQRLFARSLGVPLSAAVTAVLAMAVWLLYVLDRILDSLSDCGSSAEPPRHRFYRQHWRLFLPPFFAVLIAALWLTLTELDKNTIQSGLVLILAVGVYFFSIHIHPPHAASRLPKELVVAVLFASGTSFPVWQQLRGGRERMLAPLLIFVFLCWLNCAAIEFSEWEGFQPRVPGDELPGGASGPDELGAAPHASTVWIGRNVRRAALATALAATLLAASGFLRAAWPLYAAEALSAMALAMVQSAAGKMPYDLFRIMMDVALFAPALLLPLAWR